MRRRDFVRFLGGGLAAWPLKARAKPVTRLLRIGSAGFSPKSSPFFVAFERRMAELGYRDGETYTFDYVRTNGPSPEDYEAAYRKVVEHNPDVIFAPGTEIGLRTSLALSQTTPIVIVAINYDPVTHGYVASLSQPGGRITGVSAQQNAASVKRLEFLKEAIPDFNSAIVFFDPISTSEWATVESAGNKFGIRLVGLNLHDPPFDFDRALAETQPDNRKNLLVLSSPRFVLDRERLVEFALRNRLRSCFTERAFVAAGGLMSYGASIDDMFRRAAEYVDRIAQGAKPADLPIEQPTKFGFVINLTTARVLGLDLSQTLLARADEVIE
jgi:putative ABC transport system substrate-binding protein